MSFLTVGGTVIPVAPGSGQWDWNDQVDRRRSFSGEYRASATGGAARDGRWTTPPVSKANAAIYRGVLQKVDAQLCIGDMIEIPTMCCAELLSETPVKSQTPTAHLVTLSFGLHEVQGKKLLLKYSPGDTIAGESFLRSTTARQNSSAGVVTSAAINAKRDAHYIGVVRHLLLEGSRGNLCLQSENFGTTWTLLGTPVRTAAFNTAAGVTLDLIGDDTAAGVEGYEQVIAFTGNAVKAISAYVNGAGSTTSSVIRLQDNTAVATRLLATLTWAAGLPVVTMTTGTYFGYEVLAGGVFRLLFATTTVTAANSNQLGIYPATTAALAAANTGNLAIGGVQAEDASFPSSYTPTTTVSVIRAAETYSLPFTQPPGETTFYAKFIELGTISTANARVFEVSDAPENRPDLYVYAPSGTYVATHGNVAGDVSSGLAGAGVRGDLVELCVRLFGDGSVDIRQSINGGAETSGAQSIPRALAIAWSASLVWLNSAGTTGGEGYIALQSFKIVAGARSLVEMRAV